MRSVRRNGLEVQEKPLKFWTYFHTDKRPKTNDDDDDDDDGNN
jgi:hypothetical protein